MGQSTPEQELNRAWCLIAVARGMVRERAGFRPVSTDPPREAENPEAEFMSLPGPGKKCPISGLSRSTLYELAALGKIRTIFLRREGNVRGKRLIAVESVRHYLRTRRATESTAGRFRLAWPNPVSSSRVGLDENWLDDYSISYIAHVI